MHTNKQIAQKPCKVKNTEILVKIRKIVRSINLESKKIQKEYGVSIPQILCLNYLENADNFQASHKDITKFLNLNSSTATGIVYRLEKKGYLARLPKGKDKRLTYIALTSKGKDLLDSIPPLLHDKISTKLENLPTDKRNELTEALDTIVKLLDIEKVDASPLITMEDNLTKE